MPLNVKQGGPGTYCCAAGMLYSLSLSSSHTHEQQKF